MTIYQIVALLATLFCLAVMSLHFLRIIKLGKPRDHSRKSGNVSKGILYANTAAMSPFQKESAYLHLPTYATGIVFHIGIFMALLLYVGSFFTHFSSFLHEYKGLRVLLELLFLCSSICGILLFVKRILSKTLRMISNGDDFISNGVTTLFLITTLLSLIFAQQSTIENIYYLSATLLFFYMPWGKLKHFLYYFAARYHLGFFYGWRNVWPPKS